MAPNTDFPIPVNSEIDLFVKHSKGLEISLDDPQHLPPHPPPETRSHQPRTFSLEPIFKKHTQKLFIASNWSLSHCFSNSAYNSQLP